MRRREAPRGPALRRRTRLAELTHANAHATPPAREQGAPRHGRTGRRPRAHPLLTSPNPPTTSQDHLLLQELIDGQVTSLKEVYLWVDINGCKIIEAMTRKVTWMAAYNEITAWAVEQDHFKIKMVGKKVRARQPQELLSRLPCLVCPRVASCCRCTALCATRCATWLRIR